MHLDIEDLARFLSRPDIHNREFVIEGVTLVEWIHNLQFGDRSEFGSLQHSLQDGLQDVDVLFTPVNSLEGVIDFRIDVENHESPAMSLHEVFVSVR